MLRTRLWMGAILIALSIGMLVIDGRWLYPWCPFLLLFLLVLALTACFELLSLLDGPRRPVAWLCYVLVAALILANWPGHVLPADWHVDRRSSHWVVGAFVAGVLLAFLTEMATFRQAGESVNRIALTVWIVTYLGLLPSFIAQLRWLGENAGSLALALAIFVPKCCDIGAYFTGRLLGKHRMAPVLSPKKTWEGTAGGLVTAVIVAFAINRVQPIMEDWKALGFGLMVGVAGILGDLAESLIKRDCKRKDASQNVPGFGGVLDVVDSVVFAAPVACVWLV